jgi:hypothetical protein
MRINASTTIFNKIATNILVFVALAAVAIITPYSGNQFITGPLVNASLLLAVALLGVREALILGILPSCIALTTGLLPAVLAPQIPFIILSNAILVTVFGMLRNKNFWLGMVTGSILKFAFLFGISSVITSLIMNDAAAAKVSAMLSWPQFVTALTGGILAYGLLKIIRKS